MRKALVRDKVVQATIGIRELDEDWKLFVVSAEDRRDQINARVEIRVNCERLLAQPGFNPDSQVGQVVKAVLEYFEGEEGVGL